MTFDNRAYMREYRLKHKDEPLFQARLKELRTQSYERHKSDPDFKRARCSSAHTYRERHKDEPKFQAKQRRDTLKRSERYRNDPLYREHVQEYNKRWREKAGESYRQRLREAAQERIWALWEVVFQKYGSHCLNCGESDRTVLQLHHVNGDGAVERKRMRKCQMLKNAIEHPECYSILCANCHIRIHAHIKVATEEKTLVEWGTP